MMSKNKILILAAIAIAVIAGLLVAGLTAKKKPAPESAGPEYHVKRGPLTISFVEAGTIKAREQIIIKNEVEGTTSIISLIPEGSRVKKGDLLAELDASSLVDQKVNQEITVQNAEASYVGSKENLAVVENQAKSDVDLATLTLDFAKQDLQKYIQGEYPYTLNEADAKITLAQEELAQAQEKLQWSEKLAKEKYISQTELQSDRLAAKRYELNVELAKKSKGLLEDYTHKRNLAQFQSDLSQAEMALERTQRKAKADIVQAEAGLKAKEAEYQSQQDKLKKIVEQIKKTRIYAPADGLAIYATSAKSGGFRGNTTPLEEGQTIREREELIYLPTGNSTKAEIRIHESNLEKTSLGLPAVITIDAIADKTYYGTVEKIAPLPDAQSMWMNPDLKVYVSEIYIDSNDESLRTGMGCQAEVIIKQYQDVIYVPLQSVIRVGTTPTVYVNHGVAFEPRAVELGLDNNKMVHVLKGLDEGDIILMNPPLKSAAINSINTADTNDPNENKANQLQEKINQGIKNAESKKSLAQPAGSNPNDNPDMIAKGNAPPANIDPQKMEEMRKKFESLSPEEKEKMKENFKKAQQQSQPAQDQQ